MEQESYLFETIDPNKLSEIYCISASPGGALGLGLKEAKALPHPVDHFLSKGFKETCPSGESRIKGADSTNSEVCITLVTIGYLTGH